MAKRDCVEHFVSGRDAWKVGALAFLSRYRGIAATILLTLASMGVPWWWPGKFQSVVKIDLRVGIPAVGIAVALTLGSALWANRTRSRRSSEIRFALHELAHLIRNSVSDYRSRLQARGALSQAQEDHDFKNYVRELCNKAEAYMTEVTSDRTVSVAVRLASRSAAADSPIVYRTIGRSGRFSEGRDLTSQAIPANEGIPAYLANKNNMGILVYNDIQAAAKMGTFKITENEAKFPGDVVSLMVAPLNAWSGTEQTLIGLLYVASRNKAAFSVRHVDSMRFLADTIANAISVVVEEKRRHRERVMVSRGQP